MLYLTKLNEGPQIRELLVGPPELESLSAFRHVSLMYQLFGNRRLTHACLWHPVHMLGRFHPMNPLALYGPMKWKVTAVESMPRGHRQYKARLP